MRRDKTTWSKEALDRLAIRVSENADKRENFHTKQLNRISKMKDTFKRY